MSRASPSFKLVLLGDGRVGKTSMTLRFVNNVFSDKQMATIQASYLTKRVTVDNQMVTLAVWDTAGQERFHALGPIYYRDADAALLVYDIMDTDSFNRVKSWVKELRKMANKNIVMAIAGNKSDMDRLRKVDLKDSESYAESIGARHFLTSAKMNTGIEEAFLDIARRLLEKRMTENLESASAAPHRKHLVIIDDPVKPPPASRCCS